MRRRLVLPAAVPALGLLLLAGCATHTTSTTQVTVSTSPLPAGALSSVVLQPNEAPNGTSTLAQATGPADVTKIASFAADPAAAQAALTAHGFAAAYVVEYADLDARTTLVVTVVQFATAAGADAQVVADLAAPLPAGATRPTVAAVGDRSGAVVQPAPTGSGQLASVRFRVGRLDYLVAATGPGQVDAGAVDRIAATIAAKAKASPESA